jgi:hypothetical protein
MASTRRIIRKALVEVIESKATTAGERLKACRLLLKMTLAPKGKPRGRTFAKKGESTPRTASVESVFSDSSDGRSVSREEFLKEVFGTQ